MSKESPDDAAWDEIVASLRQPDPDGAGTWPESENVEPPARGPEQVPAEPTPPSEPPEPVIIWRGSREDVDAELERAVPDEHFVPPDPEPLPRADAITWAAWIGVIGGPLLMFLLSAFGRSSSLLAVASVAAFLGGFLVLVTRMRARRDPHGPDDGAVV